jgi:hypothetical protein
VCGGEESIREYCRYITKRGAEIVVKGFGTYIMDCPGSRMRDCNFANIRMPLDLGTAEEFKDGSSVSPEGKIDPKRAREVSRWIQEVGCAESGIYFQNFLYRGNWWWRISGMIYLEEADFRKGTEVLSKLCERVRKGEYLKEDNTKAVEDDFREDETWVIV